MPQGIVKPANQILIAGTPLVEECEVNTATYAYPGRIAIRETDDSTCTYAGAGALNPIGVFDVEAGELESTA